MRVIVCIDDRGGMLFNNRRNGRDKALLEDVRHDLEGGVLLISGFSEKLIEPSGIRFKVDEDFLTTAGDTDTCFVEGLALRPHLDRISELVIYNWNRRYPSDTRLDIDPAKDGFRMLTLTEFKGNAHERITKEVYVK